MTGASMWLWWFAAKMTGPFVSIACSRPSTRIQAKTRASGRSQVGRLTRRTARAGHERFHVGKSTGSADAASAFGACSTSDFSWPRSRATENAPSSMRVSNASSSATISSTRSSELSPSSSSVVVAERSERPAAYFATSAVTRSVGLAVNAGAWPLEAHCAIAVRLSLRVPSVRGSSPSGQTSARRIFW